EGPQVEEPSVGHRGAAIEINGNLLQAEVPKRKLFSTVCRDDLEPPLCGLSGYRRPVRPGPWRVDGAAQSVQPGLRTQPCYFPTTFMSAPLVRASGAAATAARPLPAPAMECSSNVTSGRWPSIPASRRPYTWAASKACSAPPTAPAAGSGSNRRSMA